MKLAFCCVLRASDTYSTYNVNRLLEMLTRNMPPDQEAKFICFTDTTDGLRSEIQAIPLPDDPNTHGWFAKMYMFKNAFPDDYQVFFFDLDTVFTGHVDGLLEYRGKFGACSDFLYPGRMNSSIMSWHGETGIYEKWEADGFPLPKGGDQVLIENYVGKWDKLQDFWPDKIVSYRKDCRRGLPGNASIVCFHGKTKPWCDPSELNMPADYWIPEVYTEGNVVSTTMRMKVNEEADKIHENIRFNSKRELPWFYQSETKRNNSVCIVGGGPSLPDNLPRLREFIAQGADVVGLNGSSKWLQDNGITPSFQVMLDARPENIKFIENSDAPLFYLSSQVHPGVFDAACAKADVVVYHTYKDEIDELLPGTRPEHTILAAGTTVGNNAIALCFGKGYRDIHCFGMDSSISEVSHHAYEQPENDKLETCYADINGKRFLTQNWMAAQSNEFYKLARLLAQEGCTINVHGEGTLLAEVAKSLVTFDGKFNRIRGRVVTANDVYNREVIFREVYDVRKVAGMCEGRGVAIQAGGNWGLFAIELAGHFQSVLTFEPETDNYECLKQNVHESGYKNIDHYNMALGKTCGTVSLDVNPLNAGAHRIAEEGTPVLMCSIDSLNLGACDLIMLDVEGSELEALKGGVKTITSYAPVIAVEQNMHSPNVNSYLEALDYELVSVVGNDKVYKRSPVV